MFEWDEPHQEKKYAYSGHPKQQVSTGSMLPVYTIHEIQVITMLLR